MKLRTPDGLPVPDMLLAAGSYDKFTQLMRNNVKQRKKAGSDGRSRA